MKKKIFVFSVITLCVISLLSCALQYSHLHHLHAQIESQNAILAEQSQHLYTLLDGFLLSEENSSLLNQRLKLFRHGSYSTYAQRNAPLNLYTNDTIIQNADDAAEHLGFNFFEHRKIETLNASLYALRDQLSNDIAQNSISSLRKAAMNEQIERLESNIDQALQNILE